MKTNFFRSFFLMSCSLLSASAQARSATVLDFLLSSGTFRNPSLSLTYRSNLRLDSHKNIETLRTLPYFQLTLKVNTEIETRTFRSAQVAENLRELILTMLSKGLDLPAKQLHALSLIPMISKAQEDLWDDISAHDSFTFGGTLTVKPLRTNPYSLEGTLENSTTTDLGYGNSTEEVLQDLLENYEPSPYTSAVVEMSTEAPADENAEPAPAANSSSDPEKPIYDLSFQNTL